MAKRNTWFVAAFLLVDAFWVGSAAPRTDPARLGAPQGLRKLSPSPGVLEPSQPSPSPSVHKRSAPFPPLEELLSPFPRSEKWSPPLAQFSPPPVTPHKRSVFNVKPSSSNQPSGSTRVTAQTSTKNKQTAPKTETKTKSLSTSSGNVISQSGLTDDTLKLLSNAAAAGAAAGVLAGAKAGFAVSGGSQSAKPNSVSKSDFVDNSKTALAAAAGALAGASSGAVAGAVAALESRQDITTKSPVTLPVFSASTTRSNKAPATTPPAPTATVQMPNDLMDSIIITPSFVPKCLEGQQLDSDGRCRDVWSR